MEKTKGTGQLIEATSVIISHEKRLNNLEARIKALEDILNLTKPICKCLLSLEDDGPN